MSVEHNHRAERNYHENFFITLKLHVRCHKIREINKNPRQHVRYAL